MGYKDKERQKAFQRKWAAERTARLRSYKDGVPCADCGGIFPPYVMDFDHRDDKRRDLSGMITYNWESVELEIAKCDIVCANCHRIRTHNRLVFIDKPS